MNDKEYNGWTNYATWRVNLELFDGMELDGLSSDAYALSKQLQEMAEDAILETTRAGIGRDYALAFLDGVDWYQIAEHKIADGY